MIIVNLKGGLGNQMFQYALAYVLAKKRNTEIFCDTRLQEHYKKKPPPRNVPRDTELNLFGIDVKKPPKLYLFKVFQIFSNYRLRKYISYIFDYFGILILRERSRTFEKRILVNKCSNLYLDGYWQNEKYFNSYRNDILKLFHFSDKVNNAENISFINKINFEKSVCLNVRRTDFLTNPEHNTIDVNYYKKAKELIENKINKKLNYFIFSDDIKWCQENLNFINNKFIVTHEYAGNKFFNYLYLMSNFKNYIIPNSSFAWWAAWLSKHDNKLVIAPKKWSGLYDNDKIDIVPPDWIRI